MHLPATRVRLWFFMILGLLLPTFGFAAPPGPGTLGARLALEQTPGLKITLQESDALTAHYTVSAPQRVPAVSEAVKAYLVTQGWLSHPNVSEAPAPKPGVVQQLESFVQESDLLELHASQAGAQDVVTLELTLISLEALPQVAAAP